jgi:peptidyl-prolyl cis-trans isomerase B (cyclophilin B)
MTIVKMETNLGVIRIELHDDRTPETVKNFLNYVDQGLYDNTIFHRVINDFMIQGGGFEPGLIQKKTEKPVKNEADLGDSNKRGTIAMARTSDPDSATAQFFINISDNNFLNHQSKTREGWGYCVFGQVIEGMDVVDLIKMVATGSQAGHQDVPSQDIKILKVTRE